MSRILPPLNALRAFEAAGRFESFTRAAEELGVSHSSISRHVRSLEHRLGAQLFHDAAPGVRLTPEGQDYLRRITPALDEISVATETVSQSPAGQVVINSDPVFALQVVAPNLGAFANANPEVDLRLVASAALADIDRYEADLAIRFIRAGTTDRPNDLLSQAPMFPYATPSLFDSTPTAEAILAARLLQDRAAEIWLTWAAAAQAETVPQIRSGWRLRAPLALEAARGGYGVYLSSSECVNALCQRGELKRLSDTGIQDGAYRLLTQDGATRRKAVRTVRTWLLELTAPFREGPFWEKDQPIG